MITPFRSGLSATALTLAIAAAGSAGAQNAQGAVQPSSTRAQGPGPNDEPIQIGPQQLRDFQLTPRERIVTQPQPTQNPPANRNAAPFTPTPAAPRPAPRPATGQQAPVQQRPAQTREAAAPAPTSQTPPAQAAPAPAAAPAPTPAPVQAAPEPAAAVADGGSSALPQQAPAPGPSSDATVTSGPPLWVYFLTLVTLGLLGYGYWLRRQAVEKRMLALTGPRAGSARAAPSGAGSPGAASGVAPEAPREPAAPRPAPVPRAWIDVEVVPERVSADPNESVVEFELILKNSGASTADNIKLQAKMFPSTPEQDQEITEFYRMRPGGTQRTLDAPPIAAGEELRVKGRVELPADRIKVLRVEDRLLLIPLIAFNVFYDWGSTRSGQSSRSFIIGRERTDANDKMAPFRLDLGARIYRTVGRRTYKLERRV